MASVVLDSDPLNIPSDVVTLLLGSMSIQDRSNCALVCSDWAKAAAAAPTRSIVRHGMRDLTQLQLWLEKNGGQVEMLQLHKCGRATLAAKLQHLSMHSPPTWAAADYPGLQELQALTSLSLQGPRDAGRFPACVSRFTALQQLELVAAKGTELIALTALTALTKLGVTQLTPSATPLQLPALQHLELRCTTWKDDLLDFGPNMHASYLASCTQLQRLSLQHFCFTGPGSLVASSMLQELTLQDCEFSRLGDWELVFPGLGRLPHLTSLVLLQCAQHHTADFERGVACCSGLQVLQLGVDQYTLQEVLGVSALAPLPHLTRLYLNTACDQSCNSLAHLTGLRVLHVSHPWAVSVAGLRGLARLEQLTALGFGGVFQSHKVGRMVQKQLSDRDATMPPCDHALVNKAPAGSPPDVSARLLRACDLMAADGQQQH